ncbi:hypothetical protein DUE52_23975 [Larkinella punicea]|uniref:Uncharacterized protein n=1 Tax=Larkinella punicea TaxID=2315727 RepID=A0A368JKM4_9BACT|nr:hypothetical protein DUE52_23975 [Larkinella punicea]
MLRDDMPAAADQHKGCQPQADKSVIPGQFHEESLTGTNLGGLVNKSVTGFRQEFTKFID